MSEFTSTARLPFGTLGDRNAVFVGFYVHSQLYLGYPHVSENDRNREYTQILLLMRWDGRFGFPGGLIDSGESLREAALREVQEEINFFLVDAKAPAEEQERQRSTFQQRLKPIASHQIKPKLNAHLFSCEITPQEREWIRSNSHLAEHANAEVAGVNFVHCFDLPTKGLSRLIARGSFAPGVRDELSWLLEANQIQVLSLQSSRGERSDDQ